MTKSLLFLAHRIPWPPDKGEKIRPYHIIRHLSARYQVHLGCLMDDAAEHIHTTSLMPFCATIGAFPINRRWQQAIALLRARPGRPLMPDFYSCRGLHRWTHDLLRMQQVDAIYISSVAMLPYAADAAATPRILDAIDIDSEKWRAYARDAAFPMRAVWAREARTLLAYERQAATMCDATLFVSEAEARRFVELAPEASGRVDFVENGVDLERFSPAFAAPKPYDGTGPVLVFTGNMDYWPNADAVIWFADAVWPGVRQSWPDAQFWIVGANPTAQVRKLEALPGVHVTGRVADTRPYVAHASACVCPLRIARGIQNKLLEGMAMGRPVIATPAAFEGVRAQAGRDLLVSDGADAFRAAIDAVLRGAHADMALQARRAMEVGYAWPRVLQRLDRHLP
jgi:sugar transferase (PEP-CTERM/EpsH1 system associated)